MNATALKTITVYAEHCGSRAGHPVNPAQLVETPTSDDYEVIQCTYAARNHYAMQSGQFAFWVATQISNELRQGWTVEIQDDNNLEGFPESKPGWEALGEAGGGRWSCMDHEDTDGWEDKLENAGIKYELCEFDKHDGESWYRAFFVRHADYARARETVDAE